MEQTGDYGPLEIRVVSNLSDVPLQKTLSKMDCPVGTKVAVDCAGRIGVNVARNLGASRASGELFFFLDDDCALPRSTFLSELDELFREAKDYSALGGGYQSVEESSWRARGYNSMANAWVSLGLNSGKEKFHVQATANLLGGNVCYRHEIFRRGFRFDENLISGGDEAEFHKRLNSAGYRLGYSEQLSVLHSADASWAALFSRAWNQGRARAISDTASPGGKRGKVQPFFKMLRSDPAALRFSLVHFPVVAFAQLANAPKFSQAIENLRGGHEEENLWGQIEPPPRKTQVSSERAEKP